MMPKFTNQYSQFDLVQYYMEIFNIERSPEFYGNQCLNVIMPNEPKNVTRFIDYMEMLGYETAAQVYWENIGITNKAKFVHLGNQVLLVTFNSINNPSN